MNKEQPYDSGDPKQVNKARQKAYSLEEKLANGIAKICNDPECRYALSEFLEIAGVFRDTYVTDPRNDARNQGWRAAGLWWLSNALLHDPSIVAKMQQDKGTPLIRSGNENDRDDHSDTSSE